MVMTPLTIMISLRVGHSQQSSVVSNHGYDPLTIMISLRVSNHGYDSTYHHDKSPSGLFITI